jgi:hypothetical protein
MGKSRLGPRSSAEEALAFGVEEVLATIGATGLPLSNLVVKRNPVERIDELRCSVRRHSLPDDHRIPPEISSLTERQGVSIAN